MDQASYADMAVGAIFARLPVPDADLTKILADLAEDKDAAKERILRFAWKRFPGLLVHEWAHLWQVAQYPLLLVRAARHGKLLSNYATRFRTGPDVMELPATFTVADDWMWSGVLEETAFRFRLTETGVYVNAVGIESHAAARAAGRPVARPVALRGVLREADLLEEDATIVQYRVEIGSRGTGPGYRRWLSETTRYSALFHFLTDLPMSDGQALALIPVITRVAFRTTRPLEGLGAILADLHRDTARVYATASPDTEWDLWVEDFFLGRLHDRYGEADDRSVDFQQPGMADEQGVITDAQIERHLRRTPHLVVSRFGERSRADGDFLARVLRTPSDYFERRASSWDPRLATTHAPSTGRGCAKGGCRFRRPHRTASSRRTSRSCRDGPSTPTGPP